MDDHKHEAVSMLVRENHPADHENIDLPLNSEEGSLIARGPQQ